MAEKAYKLKFKFRGPYRIVQIMGNTMIGESLATGKLCRVSLRNVKIYRNENITKKESPNSNKPFPDPQGDVSESDQEE